MAFKIGGATTVTLDTIEKMFQDFSDRKLKGLLTYQGQVLNDYQKSALKVPDVALKLPTGSGKTLVGLLIADWRRRKFGERAVYLCPTNQLVNQVVEEARSKYGMGDSVRAFTGSQRDYEAAAKNGYQSGELVAVTSYSALFNVNPFFDEPNFILFDDAHAAENYLINFWSVSIPRDSDHNALFTALTGVVQQVLPPHDIQRLQTEAQSLWDYHWVDLIPSNAFAQIRQQFVDVVDVHARNLKLRYSWSVIRDHLAGCQVYVGSQEILIRPLIPPTQSHAPCANANQRLYMSATLGEGGDLERLTGVRKIHRLAVPDDLNAQGVGRRFFIFPGRSLSDKQQQDVQNGAIERAGRAVILAPDFRTANGLTDAIAKTLSYPTFTATEIEESKTPFLAEEKAVAILANRYDGIDFPDEQCRLLIMNGLPNATNLQEKFLLNRMGARLLLLDRVRTRVVQAVGRCNRSTTDYSAVMIFGENLLTYLSKKENRGFLHPELQAEISFGLDQSKTAKDMLENLNLFFARGEEWKAAENEIRRLRTGGKQAELPSHKNLAAAVPHEVDFQYALWNGDWTKALESARKVLAEITDAELQGYRCLWNYLAGCAAGKMALSGSVGHEGISREYYSTAARIMPSIGWLRALGGPTVQPKGNIKEEPGQTAAPLVERLECMFEKLGTMHDQKYAAFEKLVLDGIAASDTRLLKPVTRPLDTYLDLKLVKRSRMDHLILGGWWTTIFALFSRTIPKRNQLRSFL